MALRLYLDEACTQEITASNRDTVKHAVTSGSTMTDERAIYMLSDDFTLTYENILIQGSGDEDGADAQGEVDVTYAPDNAGAAGTYAQSYEPAPGDYTTALKIWRKVVAPAVTAAFNRTDISHSLDADEYAA